MYIIKVVLNDDVVKYIIDGNIFHLVRPIIKYQLKKIYVLALIGNDASNSRNKQKFDHNFRFITCT